MAKSQFKTISNRRLFGLLFYNFIFLSLLYFVFSFGVKTSFASAPSLYFSSAPTIEVGDRVTINVKVEATTESINAITGSVTYPSDLLAISNISKDKSIVSFWTQEPKTKGNRIIFEGVILNPGFLGSDGNLFSITFEAKKTGTAILNFAEGGVLANDGYGSNLLTTLGSTKFSIKPTSPVINIGEQQKVVAVNTSGERRLVALPVITEYSASVASIDKVTLKGKGEPNSLTKIVFKDVAVKSLGEQLIAMLQTKKKKLDEVLVKNNDKGMFEYVSNTDLLSGVYNATPFLVDTDNNTEKPGLGVQLLVSDSKIVKSLVVVLNVLGLFIPIVALCVIIYFIPWYSWRRMRVLRKKLGLEEEKIDISTHQLERQDKILDKTVSKLTHAKK